MNCSKWALTLAELDASDLIRPVSHSLRASSWRTGPSDTLSRSEKTPTGCRTQWAETSNWKATAWALRYACVTAYWVPDDGSVFCHGPHHSRLRQRNHMHRDIKYRRTLMTWTQWLRSVWKRFLHRVPLCFSHLNPKIKAYLQWKLTYVV